MELEQAINHAQEIANRYQNIIETNNHGYGYQGDGEENCKKCAEEHSLLANWLRELQDYKKHIPDACKHCSNHPLNGGSGICHCTLGMQKIY